MCWWCFFCFVWVVFFLGGGVRQVWLDVIYNIKDFVNKLFNINTLYLSSDPQIVKVCMYYSVS